MFGYAPEELRVLVLFIGLGFAALFIIAGIAIYGFRVSLAGNRLFDLPGIESR